MQLLFTEPQNVFKLCKNTFQLYKKSWVKAVILSLAFVLFFSLLQVVFTGINYVLSLFHTNGINDNVFPIVQFIVSLFFVPFYTNVILYTIFLEGMDNPVSWKNVFKLSAERLLQAFLALIFTMVTAMLVGMLIAVGWYLSSHISVSVFGKFNAGKIFTAVAGLCIVSYIFPLLIIYFPQIILEGKNSIESYQRNFQLASGNRFRIIVLVILAIVLPYIILSFILSSLFTLVLYTGFHMTSTGWPLFIINFIQQIILMPLAYCATTVLWNDLRLRKNN